MPTFPQHLPGIVPFAHALLGSAVSEGCIAVDATAGNGHDTALLAQLVGDSGHVYAFDIQPTAIARTQQRLAQHHLSHRATLFCTGHEHLLEHVPTGIQAIIFNLGWLPGSDKSLATLPETTLIALNSALKLLNLHGILVLVLYQGHTGAHLECEAVENWLQSLNHLEWRSVRYQLAYCSDAPAPYVLALERVEPVKPS